MDSKVIDTSMQVYVPPPPPICWNDYFSQCNQISDSLAETLKGGLNPNFRPFSFELNKK